MQRNLLYLQVVEEVAAYVLQQHGSPRHQIRNAAAQLIDMIEGIAAHIHEFRLALLGIGTVGNGLHAMTVGGDELHIVLVGEGVAEMRHTVYPVLCLAAVGGEETLLDICSRPYLNGHYGVCNNQRIHVGTLRRAISAGKWAVVGNRRIDAPQTGQCYHRYSEALKVSLFCYFHFHHNAPRTPFAARGRLLSN